MPNMLSNIDRSLMDKNADIVEDRILWIENDLRTYVDLRRYDRQHRNNEFSDDLGGGNTVMTLSLFAALGLLCKVYICIKSNEEGVYDNFFNEHGHAKDDQKIFVEFTKFLGNKYDLLEDDNYRVIGLPFYNERHTKESSIEELLALT